MNFKTCDTRGCERPPRARKLCRPCYKRWQRKNPGQAFDWRLPIQERIQEALRTPGGKWIYVRRQSNKKLELPDPNQLDIEEYLR